MGGLARLLIGTALLPSAFFLALAAGRTIAGLTRNGPAAWPFLAGMTAIVIGWWFGRYAVESIETAAWPIRWVSALSRRSYVFAHEITHALAAWSVGAKVHSIEVGRDSGHVDVSHMNAFVALAPYCIPLYTLLIVLGYRGFLWLSPGRDPRALFLVLIGASIGFHLLKTFETIWDVRQPDLPAAGGVVFSLSWIVIGNAVALMLLSKVLFPRAVELSGSAQSVLSRTRGFWAAAWLFLDPLRRTFVAQLGRP
jgi:hypothetical protein